MMRKRRVVSLMLVMVLCMGMTFQAQAANLSDAKKKAEELESKKEAAQSEKDSLSTQLEGILTESAELEKQIAEKEEELAQKEDELIEAQIDENNQYEDMKKRIKYMYENGNAEFMEILFQSETLSDFLNNAEYISTISEYDRDMLVEFQKIVKTVEEQEQAIQEEYDEMETMQNELVEKQNTVQQLIDTKSDEISDIDSEIAANKDEIAKLEAAAADAARKQQEKNSSISPNAGASVVSGNGMFTHPCPGYSRISSYFGYREQPLAGASTNHKGMDFAAPQGTPIYAAAAGTVTSSGYSGKAGKRIVINHGNGLVTNYMHCHTLYVSAGTKVSKGQNIAAVGTTGNSTGNHLHFQVNLNGTPVNPLKYL